MSIEINFIITSYINLIYSRNLIKNITIINHIPKQIKKLLNERSCSIYPDIHRFRLSTTILHNKIQKSSGIYNKTHRFRLSTRSRPYSIIIKYSILCRYLRECFFSLSNH